MQFFGYNFIKTLFTQNKEIAEYTKTKWQKKTGSTNVNATVLFTFNNLEAGKSYKLSTKCKWWYTSATQNNDVRVEVSSTVGLATYEVGAGGVAGSSLGGSASGTPQHDSSQTVVFKATTNGSLTFTSRLSVPGSIIVEAILEEQPNHEETTQWT